jgi:hypothetical protein
MKGMRLIVAVATSTLVGLGGCAEGGTVLEPATPMAFVGSSPPGAPGHRGNPRILASGAFVSSGGLANATLTPQGNHCVGEVAGELYFSGTLEGTGTGTSTVRFFATCQEVELSESLDDIRTVFRSEGVFVGTVNGTPVEADFVYQGRSELGGRIDARLNFSGCLQGVLHVDGLVAQGATYEGFVIRR